MNTDIKAGTAGGIFFTLLTNLGTDIAHTALMSAVAALVSFTISWTLNLLLRKIKKK